MVVTSVVSDGRRSDWKSGVISAVGWVGGRHLLDAAACRESVSYASPGNAAGNPRPRVGAQPGHRTDGQPT